MQIGGSYISKKKYIVISERIKLLMSLKKTYLFHLLMKKEGEGMFAMWKDHPFIVPRQEHSLCPPCTANPDWDSTGNCRNLLGLAFGWFWGPPKVTSAAGKAPHRAQSQSICACTNPAPLERFIEWNIWSLCFSTSFTFTFVLVWHLHKIQRVLKQMTVGT